MIKSRVWSVKIERNNKDGSKTPIDISEFTPAELVRHQMIYIDLFDVMVLTDDLREAKAIIKHIQDLQ